MPGHFGRSHSHGDTSKGPKNSPFSSGFQGARKTSTKTKTTTNKTNNSPPMIMARSNFINTPIAPPEQKTLTGKLLQGVASGLDKITNASVKNRRFFDKNYNRIKKNYTNLPDKEKFDTLPLSEQQKIYSETRFSIMRNNQNPFGENQPDNDGPAPAPIKKVVGGTTTDDIYVGDAAGSRRRTSNFTWSTNASYGSYPMAVFSGSLIHHPNTTSAVTFKLQFQSHYSGGYTVYVNRNQNDSDNTNHARGASSITMVELAA